MSQIMDEFETKPCRLPGRYFWLLPLVCLVTASCVTNFLTRERFLGPQHWDSNRGPTIPHDKFPADCTLCHVEGNWHTIREDFQFDHEKETGVALEGAHESAQCLRCHNDRGNVAVFAKRGCVGCHEDDHRGQLGKDCSACHSKNNWLPQGQIAMHNRTRFPLMGAHAAVACFRCHKGAQAGNFSREDTRCYSCHREAYTRAKNPNHIVQAFSRNCESCHTSITWKGGRFRHNGITNNCVTCHLADFNGTTNPNHAASGFPTNCEACHNTNTWKGAVFSHAGISNNCVACHLADYNGVANPNHIASGFSKSCEMCHNTNAWKGAVFNHTFNISSGPHKIFNCTECHQVPSNFTIISCIHCHEHRKSEADNEHSSVPGYIWSSPSCINCHPTGKK